jgi:hypothetical protein
MRRIRSAPSKSSDEGATPTTAERRYPLFAATNAASWAAPFRDHGDDDRKMTLGQSVSMEEPHNNGRGGAMTWRKRSSRGRDTTTTTTTMGPTTPTAVVIVAGGGAKSPAPPSATLPPTPPLSDGPPAFATTDASKFPHDRRRNVVDSHFPPLEICVVRAVELAGLNAAAQFFDVFFADDAPYSMRDFQKKRGDVDVVYGRWEDWCPALRGERDEDNEGGRRAALYSVKEGDVGESGLAVAIDASASVFCQ